MSARGSVAVVGVAESDLGRVPDHTSPADLMAQAVSRALAACGLRLEDVDGLFATTSQLRMAPLALAEYLGLKPRYFDGTNIGGSSFQAHLAHAHAALDAGLCDVAVIAYGSTQRSVSRAAAAPREVNPWETPYRPILPTSAYALAAARHMHEYGTTRAQLAEVAVAARKWALLNPVAWEKEPLGIDEVLSARMISTPLTVRDCCLVTDGGGAMVLVRSDRARDLGVTPVFVLGHGTALAHQSISCMEDLTTTAAVHSGAAAFAMAGTGPDEMDVTILYDAFTITPILFLEDLGYCPKGEGGHFVSGGALAPGGRLAVNTNGGGLSYCHPGMWGILGMIEAVRQLQGGCGARQVPGAGLALAHGNGGVMSSQCTVIFGTEDTL
ncbi:acetyl-CoA acetyltransferase [Maritimibacter sp. HL-12]|uniref:acetyl-CoA acetyltransferase n=1 Tax=Maritimibacter sp. HL-12 TaxID=1162418 RepID=UPI000A0F13E1|nr:acetyl-CoA acetyltransferase [Maritimibacter sp. HL-12]SMH28809.1 Acetyl-CoA acetyltransferase [Maritimibacter sp. HL-12]